MWFLLVGCTSDAEIAAQMERALTGANEAILAATIAGEIGAYTQLPPTVTLRHGETCGCPCRERIDGSNDAFVLLLDYSPTGCIPDSGLLGVEAAGHVTIEWDGAGGTAFLDGLNVDAQPVAASLHIAEDGAIAGAIRIGPQTNEIDIVVTQNEDAVIIDGSARTSSAWSDLDSLRLSYTDIQGRCPRSSKGRIAVLAPQEPVVIDPSEDGMVVATWHERTSAPTDPCAYRPGWY